MAFDDPIVWIIFLFPLLIIGFVYVVVKVAKVAWGSGKTVKTGTVSLGTQNGNLDSKFCRMCGTQLASDSSFCKSCGASQY